MLTKNIAPTQGGKSMKTLKEIKVGQTVKVVKVHGEGAIRRRIMDMGITRGVEVYVRKMAPLGDPMEVFVRGYELSLRKADAEMVEVE
jgi:ferrous iron transport protein A